MHKVSVIIRCLNEARHIEKLLVGIKRQSFQNIEIVVVDSGSVDGTVEIAEQYDVQLIKIEPKDFSFGYALNVGCQKATGDLLLFASAHVYPVYDNWIEKMAEHFDNEQVALVYGRQMGNDITRYSEERVFQKWFPEISDLNQISPFCNNANTMIRKSLWETNQYDEKITGLEDMDWAKKILKQNYRIVYDARCPIVHVHEESSKQILNRYRREAIAHRNIFPEQTFSFFDFVKLTTGNVISDYYHAIRDGKVLRNLIDIPRFRYLQFYGTYKGFKQMGPISNQLKKRFYYPSKLSGNSKKEDRTETFKKINYEQK